MSAAAGVQILRLKLTKSELDDDINKCNENCKTVNQNKREIK